MEAELSCRFVADAKRIGPLRLVDLSAAGFAALAPTEFDLPPGTQLESLELLLADRAVWTGEAVVVHGADGRIGGRFTSGVLDLEHFRLGATLEGRLAAHREQREHLSAEWRAAVADVRQLLEDVKLEVDEIERSESLDPLRRNEEEAQLFEGLRARWGTAFYDAVSQLHQMSKGLDASAAALGRTYASAMLMPILMASPLDRRAYEKPLGYAGDFRMMELVFAEESAGETLFGRFLHSVTQNYTLARAVVGRERVARQAIRRAIEAPGNEPVRILALAAGPAIELRKFLQEVSSVRRPVELILLDQDRSAHEAAHRQLTRILLEQHKGMLPVTVRCLHFSVRQLLRPMTPDEQRVRASLGDLDLIYSSGLFDYLPERVASALVSVLYKQLRRNGRLLVGNLVETPDSTWIMEYVWGWPLIYRDPVVMRGLADKLVGEAEKIGIVPDPTGRCLFLEVVKPAIEGVDLAAPRPVSAAAFRSSVNGAA